jgi:hypothetical protein
LRKSPRNTSYFSTDLSEDLVADRPDSLTIFNGFGENNLDWDSSRVTELLDIGVKRSTLLLALE